jgi:hypothetical protein
MRRVRVVLALAPLLAAGIALHAIACGRDQPTAVEDAAVPVSPTADAAIEHGRAPYTGLPSQEAGPRVPVHAEFISTPVRTDTMQLMFAAGEMQTSGEPFAQNFAGRSLPYFAYSRYSPQPDQYYVPCANCGMSITNSVTDLFGFSCAVESYEYSKYHMNMVANQSGAGVSLINGPLIATLPGATPFDRLQARMEALIAATGADVRQCGLSGTNCTSFATIPPPPNNPLNDFGFPGLWPNLDPYGSFDTTMAPDQSVVNSCTSVTGYGGVKQYGGQAVFRYECDYNKLRLSDRSQADHVIGPGILGYTTWKEALWAIDFTGRLHDSGANFVTAVPPQDVAQVGKHGNTIQGVGCPPGCCVTCMPGCPQGCAPGVFIGSTPLEGMWGLTMVEEMDNAGAWLLSSLATSDGATLAGLPSVLAAIQYDYGSPLIWWPTAIAVAEASATADGGTTADRYPAVSSLTIQDAASHSVDLAALAQGYSLFFGMTDARNVAVGQQAGMKIAFGGSIFAADNQLPDGENTPHDRALGVMRVAFVDLDRMHVDPTTNVVVDTATISGDSVIRGATVTTTSLGHVVVGLRHLLMACNAAVSQYGAPDSDSSKDLFGILNSVPIHPVAADGGDPPSFSGRVRQVLLEQAQFVLETLTTSDGVVRNGATLVNGQWTAATGATTLEAQSAALRVLVEAWFLTHATAFQDRARAVARGLLTRFWSDPARMFRGQAGGADDVVMTPERFGWLQQALRETYQALWLPQDPALDRSVLEDRIARVNKLYLNGWDDLNGDQKVDKPTECLNARLQLGEQALTGEIGTANQFPKPDNPPDRESDCVWNIAYTKTASVLAGEVHFHAP